MVYNRAARNVTETKRQISMTTVQNQMPAVGAALLERIERGIPLVRGQNVLLGAEFSPLFGVLTKRRPVGAVPSCASKKGSQ